MAAIAHQWRQPLTSIGFILENIHSAQQLGKLDPQWLEESVNLAMEHIQRMSHAIDDMRLTFIPYREKKAFDLKQVPENEIELERMAEGIMICWQEGVEAWI